jgi:ribosome recycling factor
MDSYPEIEGKISKTLEFLGHSYATLRAGRANAAVLDRVSVDYYGTPTPIGQIASVSTPEPRLLVIQPWDATVLKAVEKAIQASDLGINPTNDGKVIRKVAIRNIRRDAVDTFKKQEKKSEMTEDDLKKLEEAIQKITDKKAEEIDKIIEAKSKEIMAL